MTHDKVKQDNRQLGRKALRILQLNLRFCLLLASFLITAIIIVHLNRKLHHQSEYFSMHQYMRNLFNDRITQPGRVVNESNFEEFDLIWSEQTVELFQDQLGLVIEDDEDALKSWTCQPGREFIVSALPDYDDGYLSDIMWQYISLMALQSQTIQHNVDGKKLSLKAFVTEQMRAKLDQLFEGLPLETLSNLPTSCYNLKYAQIIGNKSPIKLEEIAPVTAPLLLDPKAKRLEEIAQLFSSKMRPFWRFNHEIMNEVQQEFLVTKTIQEVEASKEMDINFVGVYLTSEDKLPIEFYRSAMNFHRKMERTIFMVVCDVESWIFCQESFGDGAKTATDVRILRKSVDTFDFALMTSCNSTIVSNDMGALHALLNGGDTTVHRPEPTAEPEYYTPWVLSEGMANWYAVD